MTAMNTDILVHGGVTACAVTLPDELKCLLDQDASCPVGFDDVQSIDRSTSAHLQTSL